MGGGGDAKRAQQAAEQAEAERQARIAEGTSRVNRAFDAPQRQAQYQDFYQALRERFMDDANRQKQVADRRTKFSLARSGLVGGSAETDTRRTLGEEYVQGILGLEDRAQGAVADLRGQDEQARMNLLQMVNSGLDSTTAASRAGAQMATSAQGAMAGATAQGLGDVFGSTADLYKRREEAAQRRRGAQDAQVSIYGKSFAR